MKNLLLSTVLVLGMMTLTTGCTGHTAGAEKCGSSKCGASAKKCGDAKDAKKCGDAKDAKKCGTSGKCGSK
ncbi:MAG: Unknown protein [uncultured Sulfurovum sp.]|uniref:Lipoprotein n=1 Tax=uncultured Sulfurovum sp. TaxID=269237 RepID=A0A6S6TKK7_9BACT|nr:MAG: Unknown protein [uncultured Sulfurovum sp.]